MQLEMGKSDKCYKGQAQEAVGLEVEHLIQFEEVTVKLSPSRYVSNEEKLVHRIPARDGHLSRPLAGRDVTTVREYRQERRECLEVRRVTGPSTQSLMVKMWSFILKAMGS